MIISQAFEEMIPIMDESMEFIICFNKMGVIKFANKTTLESLEYDSLEGDFISTLFPKAFTNHDDGRFYLTYPASGARFDTMAYRSNQTCFLIRGKVIEHENFSDIYFFYGYDISNMDALERELRSIKENSTDVGVVKNEFVANVTHELRTPVNGIQGNTKELLTHENLAAEDRKLLELIEHGCEDMHALINNILDFSKLEAGKFQLEPREFNFRDMIEYVKSNHINKINEKGLEFFVTVSPDIPNVLIGDELRIAQILNNLLSNATKFTSVGKVMVEAVTTATHGNRIEIFFMVVDTGIGIDKKDQDKLFKSFSQVEASISRRFGGTGLGLNISKQLVKLMGGNINVESELGKGTMFTFSVWLNIPGVESDGAEDTSDATPVFSSMQALDKEAAVSKLFGSQANIDEIRKRIMKLTLCLEMGTWEKAETFTDAIKQLTDGAPHEIKTAVLKLKMAVQKENSEKSIAIIEELNELLSKQQ